LRLTLIKTIIAGCRDFFDYDFCSQRIKNHINEITEIVSGRASGVDSLGEAFALEYKIPVKYFPADWKKYGKSAGPIRNKQMAEYADFLIAFWNGKSPGTKNMIDTMKRQKKSFKVYEIKE
jgi:YspA, cpYpsA-related SLOG family